MLVTKAQKVEQLYKDGVLTNLFADALNFGTQLQPNYFFSTIYCQFTHSTATGQQAVVYENIGFTPAEIAEIYSTDYAPFYLTRDGHKTEQFQTLRRYIHSTLVKNRMKYQKMIDLLGYIYNPLDNVDEKYLYSTADKIYKDESTVYHEIDNTTTHTTDQTVSTAARDFSGTAANIAAPDTIQHVENTEGSHIQNNSTNDKSKTKDIQEITRTNTGINVSDSKDAFGNGIANGADVYHVEKRDRHGNIGVTMTSQLMEAERENIRFSLLSEFFEDINKVILVGIID